MRFLFSITAVLSILSGTSLADELAIPSFRDATDASGLKSIYKGDWQYMVGGGVASFDCNGDNVPDLFLAGGENLSKFYVNRSKAGGDIKFEETQSGTEIDKTTGAYPIDIDGDGVMDLAVLRVGGVKIYQGLGGCKFRDASAKWHVDLPNAWYTAFSATWEKGNHFPTLAFGSYIDTAYEDDPWGHCSDNWLLRPNASQDGSGPRIPLKPSFCSLSMLFTDWNRSGTPSLRVANDREYYEGGEEQLWKLPPGAAPVLYRRDEGWKYNRFWGMGIASADLNGDGLPEYFISSMADQRLQFLAAGADKPTYRDAPFSMGATATRPYTGPDSRPSTGWHDQFEDVNNDGYYDLFISKGNVDAMPDFAEKDPSNLLLQKPDGNFVEAGKKSGMLNFDEARGAIVDDFNLDGKLDVLIVNRRTNVRLFANVTHTPGHWIGLRLSQDGANRDGIGAWIEVKIGDRIERREITIGGGHVSGMNGLWHFGLAGQNNTQIRVRWPDGTVSDWADAAADRFYVVSREKSGVVLKPLF
jgi:hypothetical protein